MSDRDQDYENRNRPCECMHGWLLHRRRNDGACTYWVGSATDPRYCPCKEYKPLERRAPVEPPVLSRAAVQKLRDRANEIAVDFGFLVDHGLGAELDEIVALADAILEPHPSSPVLSRAEIDEMIDATLNFPAQ